MGAVKLQGPSRPQAEAGRCVGIGWPVIDVPWAVVMIMIKRTARGCPFAVYTYQCCCEKRCEMSGETRGEIRALVYTGSTHLLLKDVNIP